MLTCPSCSTENPETNKFCSDCGGALRPEYEATLTHAAGGLEGGTDDSSASDSSHHGRFLPGTRLANRYRIVSLLGRGGMGEVYQADDLKLGQTVALKFLPKELADDPKRLEFFHSEVRLARQISHPNVCRVYDIGEVNGQHFLSMEYIDGEDLRSLLRRIGRLPPDKGLEIAIQLCAGLGAAHEKNVIHRDLKPANIMIDGRGRVRITDFGLAWEPGAVSTRREIVGTPAYMAPEQLLEGETSVQSDLYSLGLILYELFTGKPPHGESTLGELRQMHRQESALRAPSELLKEIDPAVERAILRCLEHAPHNRPRSVAGVAAALPGGDPLAAALAAGETPSPEVVAASGKSGGLHPAIGGTLLAAVFLGLFSVAWLADRSSVLGIVRGKIQPPEVMQSEAREILKGLGYSDSPADSAHWYEYEYKLLREMINTPRELRDWEQLIDAHPTPIRFVYRQSPEPLRTLDPMRVDVDSKDPPPTVPGMITMTLDLERRLQSLSVVPSREETESAQIGEPDWRSLFHFAGIPEDFGATDEPTVVPAHYADTRMAWKGVWEDREVRVEAAFYDGKPVSFRVLPEWRLEDQSGLTPPPWLRIILVTVMILAILAAGMMAWRNVRSGRCDRKGAIRLGVAFCLANFLAETLKTPTISHLFHKWNHIFAGLEVSVGVVAVIFGLYAAIEPLVRRFWPQALISWSRLLAGRITDPRVGRDALIGVLLGVVAAVGQRSTVFFANGVDSSTRLDMILGSRRALSEILLYSTAAVAQSLGILLLLVLLRMVLRKRWLADILFVAVPITLMASSFIWAGRDLSWFLLLLMLGIGLMLTGIVIVVARCGMVAMTLSWYSYFSLTFLPITADPSVWFCERSLLVLAVVAAFACFGAYTSFKGWSPAGERMGNERGH